MAWDLMSFFRINTNTILYEGIKKRFCSQYMIAQNHKHSIIKLKWSSLPLFHYGNDGNQRFHYNRELWYGTFAYNVHICKTTSSVFNKQIRKTWNRVRKTTLKDFTHVACIPSPTTLGDHLIFQRTRPENQTARCTQILSPFLCISYVDCLLSQFHEALSKLQPLPWKNNILQCRTMVESG